MEAELRKWRIKGQATRILRHIGINIQPHKYGVKEIIDVEKGVEALNAGIMGKTPFLAGRFGTSECNALVCYLSEKPYAYHLDEMCNNAGFFPKDKKYLDQYCELVKNLYGELDLLCVMNCMAEGYVVEKYCPSAVLTRLPVVDPVKTGWTSILEGKKVLVIHPMEKTIREQYFNKRNEIYPGTNILPQFELLTLKAVQTIAGAKDDRFSSWFDALNYMSEEALKKDFDIALIGCGAYGLPLGAMLKKNGKKAIHMGGCLQLLFGIRGGRWDSREDMKSIINEGWVRPSEEEKPAKFTTIEGGCYW